MGDTTGDVHRSPRLVVTRPGVVVPVPRDPTGLLGPTKGQAKGARWRQTSHGLYVPASVDGTQPWQRIVEVGAVLPAYGGVTGWAALNWMGGSWFTGVDAAGEPLDIWIATGPSDIRSQSCLQVSAERLTPTDLTVADGLPLTVAVRSVVFEMRYAASLRAAVRAADMAMYDDLVSPEELRLYIEAHPGWTGIGRAREALDLAVENSWSPKETDTRLVWRLDAGLPPLLCNRPVFDRSGNHLVTPDLLDEEAGMAIEYTGEVHLDSSRRRSDRDREELYGRLGIALLVVMTGDSTSTARLVDRMVQTRQRAAFASPESRAWTSVPPRWWIDTSTVDKRRALSAYDRERLLRYRRPAA